MASRALFRAADYEQDGKFHLLLAASGSVATIKIPNILHALSQFHRLSVRLVLTASAAKFLDGQTEEQPAYSTLIEISNLDSIHLDEDEWTPTWTRGAPILHIELRKWADLLVVAPLSANTMAKMVTGIADNLLTSLLRAWDTDGSVGTKDGIPQVAVAPAMNTAMWRHPVTAKQLAILETEWSSWVTVLRPVSGDLACGDVGDGKMVEWHELVGLISTSLMKRTPAGEHVAQKNGG